MPRIAFVNNKYVDFQKAKIHIEDRGLQFSDSVYEVAKVLNSNIIDLKFHIKRLKFSLSELKIKYNVDYKKISSIFSQLIKKNNLTNGIIYLQITRGTQSRKHVYESHLRPNVIIYTAKHKFNLPNKKYVGYKAITYPDIRWGRRDIKTTSLLANIMAANAAYRKGAYEAILIKGKNVTEAAHSNLWIVKNHSIITHPANSDILKGVTRTVIMELIKRQKMKLIEKVFNIRALYNADEVFLTGSGSLVTPLVKIDNVKINNGKIGPITKLLAKKYLDKIINASS